jgi:hypothetical protein
LRKKVPVTKIGFFVDLMEVDLLICRFVDLEEVDVSIWEKWMR